MPEMQEPVLGSAPAGTMTATLLDWWQSTNLLPFLLALTIAGGLAEFVWRTR